MQITQTKITALADMAMRQEIGAVCVHWSLLELMVERVIANLQGTPGIATYQEDLGHRRRTLKKIANKHLSLSEAQKATIRAAAGDIKILAEERHRIIHGLWGMNARGEVVSIFPRTDKKPQARPMDREAIRAVKLQTFRVIKQLEPFADREAAVALAYQRKPPREAPRDRPGQ
jgi:hypothetical protein